MALTDRAPARALLSAVEAGLLPSAGRIWIACSGGPDSMALVEVARRLERWAVAVVTIDHGLHPDSGAWADQVAGWWGARGLPVAAHRVAVGEGGNLEARARDARYRVFDGLDAPVLTGHTADDQAETLLMRIADGAGVEGLVGIRARRGRVVRPWLSVRRAEVRREAAELPVVVDPANRAPRFRRSALRVAASAPLEVALGSEWVRGAASVARHAAEATELVDALGAPWLSGLRIQGAEAHLDAAALAAPEPVRRWLLRRLLARIGVDRRVRRHLAALLAVAEGAARVHGLPGGRVAYLAADGLVVERMRRRPAPAEIGSVGHHRFGDGVLEIDAVRGLPSDRGDGVLALGGSPWPLVLRAPRPGDRIRPFGAPGRRAVGRALRDAGVPAPRRVDWPLLERRGQVLWVGGLRVAEEAAVCDPGEPAIRLRWRPLGGLTRKS